MNKAQMKARKEQLLLEGEVLRLHLLKDKLSVHNRIQSGRAHAVMNLRSARAVLNNRWLNQPQVLNGVLLLLTRLLPKHRNSLLGKLSAPLLRTLIVLNSLRKTGSGK